MRDGEIVREIARVHGVNQHELAMKLGYKATSGLNNRLNVAHGMQSDVLAKIVGALDAELIVRDKDGNEWRIDPKE